MENVSEESLRTLFRAFNRFMLLLWRVGLGRWGNFTKYGGYVMVVKHTGRKSGLIRHTPVNYAVVGGDVYCTAAFGKRADWYRNVLAQPQVEVWLQDGRWSGEAEDVTDDPQGASILRQVIIASGFAGPLFGVNPKNLVDDDFAKLLETYRLVRIRRSSPLTGPGGPGELAWIWPVTTFILLGALLSGGKRRR